MQCPRHDLGLDRPCQCDEETDEARPIKTRNRPLHHERRGRSRRCGQQRFYAEAATRSARADAMGEARRAGDRRSQTEREGSARARRARAVSKRAQSQVLPESPGSFRRGNSALAFDGQTHARSSSRVRSHRLASLRPSQAAATERRARRRTAELDEATAQTRPDAPVATSRRSIRQRGFLRPMRTVSRIERERELPASHDRTSRP